MNVEEMCICGTVLFAKSRSGKGRHDIFFIHDLKRLRLR